MANGTVLRPPAIVALYTMADGRFTLAVSFTDAAGQTGSVSADGTIRASGVFTTGTGNFIIDNRTVGILFLDASLGTNVPVQSAANSTFTGNNISGNWYGQVVDRQGNVIGDLFEIERKQSTGGNDF